MIRKLFFLALRVSCIPSIIRETIQKNKITILLYHNINRDLFTKHIQALRKAYNLISLQDYLKARKDSNYKLPSKALIITFDDGLKVNFSLLEVIQQYKIPITIFLCSSIINTKRKYWFNIKTPKHNIQELKHLPTEKRLDILRQYGFEEEKSFSDREALNKEEIEIMKKYIDFQCHSRFHPCLTHCDDDRAKKEITLSKKELEENLNLKINTFSYPNGDYTDRDIKILKDSGYEAAITVNEYFNDKNSNPYTLNRLSIWDVVDENEAIVRASGLWVFLRNFIKPKNYGYKNTNSTVEV